MEVVAKLKFTTPCLGNVRRDDYDRMLHDDEGRVMLLPSWWRAAFSQAATAISRYYHYVNQLMASPCIKGEPTRIVRRYGKNPEDCKIHEGFDTGAVIEVSFAIPGKMHIRQFIELLEAVGSYVGMSPYRGTNCYGFFQLISISTGHRGNKCGRSNNSESRRHPAGNSTVHGAAGGCPQVPAKSPGQSKQS